MSLTELIFPFEKELAVPSVSSNFLNCSFLDQVFIDLKNFVPPAPFVKSDVFLAKIRTARVLSKGTIMDEVLKITFDCEEGKIIDYLPGDTICICPKNSIDEVNKLLDHLDLARVCDSVCITICCGPKKKLLPSHIPAEGSVRFILTNCVDFRAPIKKLFLRALAEFTGDKLEKRRLIELSSKEGSSQYLDLILTKGVNILELLESFKSCRPPFHLLLEFLPPLKPRIYSIANSPLVADSSISIVFNRVYRGDGFPGICSSYLYKMAKSSMDIDLTGSFGNLNVSQSQVKQLNIEPPTVRMYQRVSNSFRVPTEPKVPLILIAAGTGIAPFIGFLEHREMLKKNSTTLGPCWLFFGCRDEDHFVFRDEIQHFMDQSVITKFVLCYSRQDNVNKSVKYVQDHILLIQSDFIEFLLTTNCRLYICGDALNMVKDVMEVIKTCFTNVKEISETDAETIVKYMIKDEKLVTDPWI